MIKINIGILMFTIIMITHYMLLGSYITIYYLTNEKILILFIFYCAFVGLYSQIFCIKDCIY